MILKFPIGSIKRFTEISSAEALERKYKFQFSIEGQLMENMMLNR